MVLRSMDAVAVLLPALDRFIKKKLLSGIPRFAGPDWASILGSAAMILVPTGGPQQKNHTTLHRPVAALLKLLGTAVMRAYTGAPPLLIV